MLDSKDLKAIQEILDKSLDRSQNTILDEVYRVEKNLQSQINRLENNMEKMQAQMNTLHLQTDNVNLFLRIVDDLRRRIEELEKKTA